MTAMPTVAANDEFISPIGWPVVPLSRVTPMKRRFQDPQTPKRKPNPQDGKPKPG